MVNVLFAEGFEEVEALIVVDMLRRAEIDVCMISADDTSAVKGAHGIDVVMDKGISEIEQGNMLFLPGGIPGVPNLSGNNRVKSLIKDYYDSSYHRLA